MGKDKKRGEWMVFLWGVGVALGVYLAGILVLAFLLVRGVLPERMGFLSLVCFGGIASAVGGRTAVRSLPWGTMLSAMLNAVMFVLVLILIGVSVWPESFWCDRSMICAGAVLLGGFAAGMFGAKRKRLRKRGRSRVGGK